MATSYVLKIVMSSVLADIGLTLSQTLLHFAWWEKSKEKDSVCSVKHDESTVSGAKKPRH